MISTVVFSFMLYRTNFRKDNLENENANLVKELERIKAEHRIVMTKQASASDMLIKEYKYQNVILQNAVSASKSGTDNETKICGEDDKGATLVRNLSHTTNEEESLLESPSTALTPDKGNKKKNKRGRTRKTNKSANKFSPVLCESQNTGSINNHSDLRNKISSMRKTSAYESRCELEENENQDPSLVGMSVRSPDDSIGSSSSILGDNQLKSPAKRGRTSKRKRNVQRTDNNTYQENKTERRSLRKSIRDRPSTKLIMPPPCNTKIENSFLSPLLENEGAITVTTTTTLSPQKTRASFITPQNKRKKLFNNETANEVIILIIPGIGLKKHYLVFINYL